MKALWIGLLIILLCVGSSPAEEKIVIGESGSLNEEITDIAKAFMSKNPRDVVEARPESLVYRVLARSLAIVTVNKALSVSGLTESQICHLLSGKSASWTEFGGGAIPFR